MAMRDVWRQGGRCQFYLLATSVNLRDPPRIFEPLIEALQALVGAGASVGFLVVDTMSRALGRRR
jgi:hypothetical protein